MKHALSAPALRILAALVAAAAPYPLPGPASAQVAPAASPRGWIGISFEMETVRQGSAERLVARVTDVVEGSPAAAAGVRVGDVLLTLNGRPWAEDPGEVTRSLRPGDAVALTVERQGRREELRLRAGTRPAFVDAPPAWTFTFQADSMAEHLYKAMDSLRVRILSSPEVHVELAQVRAATDSVLRSLERDRTLVVRMRGGDVPGAAWVFPGTPADPQAPRPAGAPRPGVTLFRRLPPDSASCQAQRGLVLAVPRPEVEVQGNVLKVSPLAPYVLGENRVAGAEVVEVRPELAEYFQVDGGVLVVDVAKGTPAEKAGILPGDVITAVAGAPVLSVADLRRGLARTGVDPDVTVVRKGRTLQVSLPR